MARVGFTRLRRGDRGFVLMEVLGAVVLFAMLVGPLTTCLLASADRVVKVCERAADLSSITAESASRLAWSWGPMVTSLRWTSGPCAVADVAGLTTSEGVIGLWVGGWFLGEWSLNGDGPFDLPAATWSGLEGRELVARVRPVDGSWGPPWRSTVLPEGYESVAVSTQQRPPVRGDGPTSGKEIVMHVPGPANPDIEIPLTASVLEVDPLGLVFYFSPPPVETSAVGLDGRVQRWGTEDGRALDLYF